MATLRHVAFCVKDPDKLYDFYRTLFGVEQVRLAPSGSIHVIDGLFNLAFLKQTATDGVAEVTGTHRADGAEADQRLGINHFGFCVNNLDDVLSRLSDSIKRGESPQNGRPAEMRAIDPWGNNFDLSSRGFLGREELRLPGVRRVVVHSPQPEETAAFYAATLDLTPAGKDRDGALLLTDGDISLAITPHQSIFKTGIQAIGWQVDDWEVAQDRFRGVGLTLPDLAPGEIEARMTDPEGNPFLVSERGWLG
jgi:catechol 2,3-dioxygenase-like lactoylglutathione lyase family enzyme